MKNIIIYSLIAIATSHLYSQTNPTNTQTLFNVKAGLDGIDHINGTFNVFTILINGKIPVSDLRLPDPDFKQLAVLGTPVKYEKQDVMTGFRHHFYYPGLKLVFDSPDGYLELVKLHLTSNDSYLEDPESSVKIAVEEKFERYIETNISTGAARSVPLFENKDEVGFTSNFIENDGYVGWLTLDSGKITEITLLYW